MVPEIVAAVTVWLLVAAVFAIKLSENEPQPVTRGFLWACLCWPVIFAALSVWAVGYTVVETVRYVFFMFGGPRP